jgi:hypothetical protein
MFDIALRPEVVVEFVFDAEITFGVAVFCMGADVAGLGVTVIDNGWEMENGE